MSGARAARPISIETRRGLVLKRPQHYHVDVITYESANSEGVFQWSTAHQLIANDVELAIDRAKRLGKKAKAHVRNVSQCADPSHLEGLDEERSS